MALIKDTTFVCLDCEATGLDPVKDRIIEVAVVSFTLNDLLASFESLIDPEMPISEASIAIHRITQNMVHGKPKIQETLPELLQVIGSHPIVGHGIGFDIDLIDQAATRASIPCTIKKNLSFDTLRLARLYGESPSNSLQQLRAHFNIEEEGAHRAMNDVVVNIQVFKRLASEFNTIKQLLDVLSKPITLKNMPLGKHKGRSMKEVPLDYLLWAARQDFDQDLLFSLRSEINRRKKGNSFAQSASPFANL
jgi:DNA polymerase III subunit epsilon